MLARSMKYFVPIPLGAYLLSSGNTISNESKRKFYEDEANVTPLPGTVTPAAGNEVDALGSNRIIDGISVRSSNSFESFFKFIRENTHKQYTRVTDYLNEGYDKYQQKERNVADTVSSLHNKREDLFPNALYIIIGGLSGTIFSRQRNILARITFPVVLATASFKYFLPETFTNTTSFIWRLEKQKAPRLAESQEIAMNKAGAVVQQIEQTTYSGKKSIDNGVDYVRKSVAGITGLNIDEDVTKK